MNIKRGEIWLVNFHPTKGSEQAGIRPAVILSVDNFNNSMANKVIVCPLTSKDKAIPLDVVLFPPEGGISKTSYIKCEDIRSISKERMIQKWGEISPFKLEEIKKKISLLLGF